MNKWWWLSYADVEGGFLGVVIIIGRDFYDACSNSSLLGLSPRGEVRGCEITGKAEMIIGIHDVCRILTKDEAQALADII